MKIKKIATLLAVTALTTSIFVGCGAKAETNKSALKDGTYTAASEADEKGYSSEIEITVAEGKISAVKYNEKDAEGVSKLDMPEYNTKMEAKTGSNPIAAYPALEASLLETQDATTVDTVTGATASTEKFITLATEALSSAK